MNEALTIDEFCRENKITRRFYYSLRERGEAPAEYRVGWHYRITREAADAWRKAHAVKVA